MKILSLYIIILLLLFNCSKNNIDENLKNRISVLSYTSDLLISSNLDTNDIRLANKKEIIYWSQSGQNPKNNLDHILINYNFSKKNKILSDSGKLTNTIQPIYFEDNLCSVSTNGILRCINLIEKKIIWQLDLRADKSKKYEILRGGLVYFDNQILIADGYGQVKLVNSLNGELIWETSVSIPILSAPLIYRGYIFFSTSDNKIYSLDLVNGSIKWSFQTIFDDKKSISTGTPAAAENIIIVPFSNGEIIAFIHDSGNIVWSENASKISNLSNYDIKDIAANPIISNESVYTISNNGRLISTNLTNGLNNWSIEISGKSSPIISDMQLYIIDNEGRLICINKNTGEIYWIREIDKFKNSKNKGELNNWKGPYLINNLLYAFSSHGKIIIVSPLTSEILSEDNLSIKNISVDPVILSNSAFFMDGNSNIFQYN